MLRFCKLTFSIHLMWSLTVAFIGALDPPGDDSVVKLRNDVNMLNKTLESLMTKYTTLQKALATSSAQKGSPVAFSVSLSSNVQLGNSQVVQFDKITTNIGNGYNKYHGQFTAPVAGIYYFSYDVICTGSAFLHVQLIKNGVELSRAFSEDAHDTGSGSAVTHLEVGDVVWLRHMSGLGTQSIEGHAYSSFSGVLIV